MLLHTKLTNIIRNTPQFFRRFAHLSSREDSEKYRENRAQLVDNLRRELYGMTMREQAAVDQLILRAGQAVTVREPTIAFGKNSTFFFLEKGSHVKISRHPLQLDENGNVRVIVINQSNKYLSLTLSDYIDAIHVSQ